MSVSSSKWARKGKTIPKYKPLQMSEEVEIKWQFSSVGKIWKLGWILIVFPCGLTEDRWRWRDADPEPLFLLGNKIDPMVVKQLLGKLVPAILFLQSSFHLL